VWTVRDTLFPIFKQHGKKSNMFDFLPVLTEFSGNSIAGCEDTLVTAIGEERATANQYAKGAAFCFGFVLLLLLLLLFVLL
jgi:hypothetical protein